MKVCPSFNTGEQTSLEVQNRGISGPTKKDLCPPKKFYNKTFEKALSHSKTGGKQLI